MSSEPCLSPDLLRWLSSQPHRGSGTEEELQAARRLEWWLTEHGHRVESVPLRAPTDTLLRGPAAVMGVMAVGLVAGHFLPWALALTWLAVVPLWGELAGAPLNLDVLLPRHRSQTLFATVESAPLEGPRILLSAHYDTQRASLLFEPGRERRLRTVFALAYTAMGLALVVSLLATVLGPVAAVVAAQAAVAALLVGTGGWLLASGRGRPFVNGAGDNGSGVALLLAVAERLRRRPLAGVNLCLALTGAEEVGERGMAALLRERDRALGPERTVVVNLDNLGAGRLQDLGGEGQLLPYPYDPMLRSTLAATLERLGMPAPARDGRLLLPTDALPALWRGYRAITLLCMDPHGRIPHYHWPTDTLAAVDVAQLARLEEVVEAYVRDVARRLTAEDRA